MSEGKIIFSVSKPTDGDGEQNKKLTEFMSNNAKNGPAISIVQPSNSEVKKFKYQGQITDENIDEFVKMFLNGNLK